MKRMKKTVSVLLALLFAAGVAFAVPVNRAEAAGAGNWKKGDTLYYGHYEQNNRTSDGSEPVLWRVLDVKDGQMLVISEYALDCEQYNLKADSSGHTLAVTWEESHLRSWLNNDFYSAAFTPEERNNIAATRVKNTVNPKYTKVNPGPDTNDRIFCLSVDEAEKYLPLKEDKKCVPTVYALARGAYADDSELKNGEKVCWWWLRTPGSATSRAAFVGGADFGIKYDGGYVYAYHPTYPKAVRPVMWLSVNVESEPGPSQTEKGWTVGDTLYFGNYEQNNIRTDGGEPILWRVIDVKNGELLLLSVYALDCEQYNLKADSSGHTSAVTWAGSHLRTWLNNDFLGAAFTAEEQAKISYTLLDNNPNPKYTSANPGPGTKDRLFCLSIDEVLQLLPDKEDMKCLPTAYTVARGAYRDDSELIGGEATCWWWLRSPGSADSRAAFIGGADFGVKYDGGFAYAYHPTYPKAVRPAMWVSADLNSPEGPTPTPTPKPADPTPTPAKPTPTSAPGPKQWATGDTLYYGVYEQNGRSYDGREKILWRVLDVEADRMLLLSEYALDCVQYNLEADSTGHTAASTWEKCFLRTFLNEEFYRNSFTAAERKKILKTLNGNPKNPKYSKVDPGPSTQDYVFALSIDEVLKYLPATGDMKCMPTSYAIRRDCYQDSSEYLHGEPVCWWWLRTPGSAGSRAAFIGGDDFGIKYDGGYIYMYTPDYPKAVRPAMWVSTDIVRE